MLDEKIQAELIAKGRAFTHGYLENDPYEADFESDQELKRTQPPLVKAPMRDESAHTPLPRDFEALERKDDLLSLIRDRRSARGGGGHILFTAQQPQGTGNEPCHDTQHDQNLFQIDPCGHKHHSIPSSGLVLVL